MTATSMTATLRTGGSPRKTVSGEVEVAGAGLHTGVDCRAVIRPAEGGRGIRFLRKGAGEVPATIETADPEASVRRTVLVAADGGRVELVEHLMAAFAAAGVSDAEVEIEGPEVPFLGGGAREFLEALLGAGLEECGGGRPLLVVEEPMAFQCDGAVLAAMPAEGCRLSAYVEYPGTVVGSMGASVELDAGVFLREIAPARTFAAASEIEGLRAAGLAKGGNLQNAVVFDAGKYLTDPLYFPDEVARHKIVDLLGDLGLLGCEMRGHFWAWRAGHRTHLLFARQLLSRTIREE